MQLARLFCPNRRCRDYRKSGINNIAVIGRYGKKQYRLLRCKACGIRFSERRWTIFFGLHTDEGTIKEILTSLLRGKSIRKTADEVGLDKDTVQRIWKRVTQRWEKTLNEFLEELDLKDLTLKDLLPSPPNLWRGALNRRK